MGNYILLSKYYKNLFSLIDAFCFNSSLAQEVYTKYINISNKKVIPITHNEIQDNRTPRIYDTTNLQLGFIGNTTSYKGYPLLEKVLLGLYSSGFHNWTLSVWGGSKLVNPKCDKILFCGKYASSELRTIFSAMDLLIVPSVWNETFSLITLEALSFGVPVLVSSTVGAKDIVKEYDDFFIFQTEIELKEKLKYLLEDVSILADYNKKIMSNSWKHLQEIHVERIREFYQDILLKSSKDSIIKNT
jgi:glycosyltransferase involved in cell wall biosynthesis